MDIKASTESKFCADGFETDYEDNLESKVTCNESLLPGFYSAKQYVPVLLGLRSAEH